MPEGEFEAKPYIYRKTSEISVVFGVFLLSKVETRGFKMFIMGKRRRIESNPAHIKTESGGQMED